MEIILIIFVTINTLILFQTFSIAHILLIAICNFFLSSALIAYNGHIFIAAIFLIVYTGAILVMICVAYLLTPSIQKKKSKRNLVKNHSDSLNIIFFNLFIIILLSSLILIQLKDNTESVMDLTRNSYIFEKQIEVDNLKLQYPIPEWFNNIKETRYKEYLEIYEQIEYINNTKYLTEKEILAEIQKNILFEMQESSIDINDDIDLVMIDFGNIILQSFPTINTINYTNKVSYIYTKHHLSFLAIGIYLLITLLICLRMFIIMAKSIIIKRQDIIDQILKIWKK